MRHWWTLAGVVVAVALIAGLVWLLRQPVPDPFWVGGLGLAAGALLALLLVAWWPHAKH